jgi:hypothetical protein
VGVLYSGTVPGPSQGGDRLLYEEHWEGTENTELSLQSVLSFENLLYLKISMGHFLTHHWLLPRDYPVCCQDFMGAEQVGSAGSGFESWFGCSLA